MPWLSTAMWRVAGEDCSLLFSASVQRLLPLVVVAWPSVMESPSAMTAKSLAGAITSMPEMVYQCSMVRTLVVSTGAAGSVGAAAEGAVAAGFAGVWRCGVAAAVRCGNCGRGVGSVCAGIMGPGNSAAVT